MLKSAVSVESQQRPTAAPESSFHVRLRQESTDLLTHISFRPLPLNCPVVLRSVIKSDVERDVQVRITCNKCPRLHVNQQEIVLTQSGLNAGQSEDLNEYSKSLHVLRGNNDVALKFEAAEKPEQPGKGEASSEIRYCVCIVDDNGKGLHEPQLTSHLVPETEEATK